MTPSDELKSRAEAYAEKATEAALSKERVHIHWSIDFAEAYLAGAREQARLDAGIAESYGRVWGENISTQIQPGSSTIPSDEIARAILSAAGLGEEG